MGGLTTHSTGARISFHFIVNMSVPTLCARPVNSGVRRLFIPKSGGDLENKTLHLQLGAF